MAKLNAWNVLKDAEAATYMLQEAADNPNANWRVPWVAAITLYRAIGHVLKKVDAIHDVQAAELIENAWPGWNKDPLFQWLESNRNSTLKEYDFGVERHVMQVWSGPKRIEEAEDARHYGFLFFEGMPEDAVQFLWSMHTWWAEKLGLLEGLLGGRSLNEDERLRAFMRFVGPPGKHGEP